MEDQNCDESSSPINHEELEVLQQNKLYEQELKQLRQINSQLVSEIDHKNQKLCELEQNSNETAADVGKLVHGLVTEINSRDDIIASRDRTVRLLLDENASLHAEYVAEIVQLQSRNLKLRSELEKQELDLEECQEKSDLRQRELLSEIETLKRKLKFENGEETRSNSDAELNAMKKKLEENSEALQDLESLNKVLTVQELNARQELQEARRESVNGLQDLLNARTVLRIKRMGEVDQKAFQKACSLKFPNEDWPELAAKLCSEWQGHVGSSAWHPFKKITVNGVLKEVVDDDNEKLKQLRNELDEDAYDAVTNALMEMNQYNASGGYVISEIWNSKEQRRATLKEIVEYLIKQVKSHKRKRNFG